MSPDPEHPDQKAIRLLNRQLEQLQDLRGLNYHDSKYKVWRDTTIRVLETFLGRESPHFVRFRDLRFFGPMSIRPFRGGPRLPPDYVSPDDVVAFRKACATSEETLKAAIRDIEDFGVYVEQASPAPAARGRGRSGGVSQTFHGPVNIQNQAIATDNAIQRIGHMGDSTGASLKEIADLLRQSEDLTPRQVREGLAQIESLAVEIQKPEPARNWKSVLDCGQAVLAIADKATDLAQKLAPYTPAIVALVENARHTIG